MLTTLLTILFIVKLKLTRSENVTTYLRRLYDGSTLRTYRRLESSTKKWKKAQLDYDFLLYCKMSNIVPNFIKFKLYRSSLYSSEFYKSCTQSLLDIEIDFKTKATKRLKLSVSTLSTSFYQSLSLIDGLYFRTLLKRTISSFVSDTTKVHERKLLKLGIQQPKFMSPDDVIFNYSNYALSIKEKFLLSLGLDFCMPNFKPSFSKFFLPFELFFNNIRHLPFHVNLESAQQTIQNIAHKAFSSCKTTNWFPFFKKEDFLILRKLAQRNDIILCRPDKGRGVVLLNRDDYIQKMNLILSDSSKFCKIGSPEFSTVFKIEDKINRTLKKLKDDGLLDGLTYNSLYSSGSSFSVLYGLPKVHKTEVPLRPILAAYNSPNFSLAKFLVPLLSNLTNNQYTLPNSSKFIPEILQQHSNTFMVSFDVQSLFTNVPLSETIDIIINKLFPTQTTLFNGFNACSFRKLLELAVIDTHFIFNGDVYKQIDGMAMGSPLGPTFANIFMCYLEEQFLNDCPVSFKPLFYRRYVDDTFLLFKEDRHSAMFLDFINSIHPNIKFTMETESNNQLSFLDILVSRCDNKFVTGIFRKKTFTGLGLNYFSFCPSFFKINSCKTLLFRAYSLCSNWIKFHEEISFLNSYFSKNCYPSFIFNRTVKAFLDNIFRPTAAIPNVPKKIMYVSLPYVGNSVFLKRELTSVLSTLYPYVDFKFIFKNPYTIGSLFHFKDTLPVLMQSCLVYFFTCPKCNFGTYIGSTKRLIKVRIDAHRGVSHRTGSTLSTKEFSSVRSHSESCHYNIQYSDFKILSHAPNQYSLPFLESLYIKQLSPHLNSQTTSVPLHIA